jgi:hypothetical protein
MVRLTILLVAWTCIVLTRCSALGSSDPLQKPPMGYELYSWQGPNGSWNFCLAPSPSGVNIQADQVFDKKFLLRGVSRLNQEISMLPIGATIYWLDHIIPETGPNAKASQSLSYPPVTIIEQVRQYAEIRHIEVQMLRRSSFSQNPSDPGPAKYQLPAANC